jgi:hypothetical protein
MINFNAVRPPKCHKLFLICGGSRRFDESAFVFLFESTVVNTHSVFYDKSFSEFLAVPFIDNLSLNNFCVLIWSTSALLKFLFAKMCGLPYYVDHK